MAACCISGTKVYCQEQLDFNRDIRPLLSDRCFACHGPDAGERHADLRLDDEQAAKAYAIETGQPEASLMIQRIRSQDPDMVMPPPETGKPLSAEEVERLERWISEGAVYAKHWAYVAPKLHAVPQSDSQASAPSWIDAFVQQKLEAADVQAAELADPVSQIRRLSYDLTGLPPSQDLVEAMRADPSEDTYRIIVDRLLGSPRFGERMASLWFDLVRYADTVGYHGDQDHNIAPYRDWVIDAFNSNLPFDQFTREQLAGDLLDGSTIDQKIASGYNRLLQTTHEGGLQPKEYLAIYAADRVRNVSAVWMGATLGCAQCHDHKYDPFTAKDFYSMAAFFADIDEDRHFREGKNSLPTNRPPELDVLRPIERERLRELDRQISDLTEKQLVSEAELAKLTEERDKLKNLFRRTMISVSTKPREIRVLPRGNWLDDSGPVVEPAVPEFLQIAIERPDRADRLDLANWLTDVDSGYGAFTARVMVNRFWGMLFGQGLSRSLEDFGGQGQPPSHPELLDNLAVQFYSSGWDVKQVIREIVLSETYRRSSATLDPQSTKDIGNVLLARQNRFRLPAEMIRDQALALSGLLVLEEGGSSSRPYQPVDYYKHLNFPERTYKHDTDRNQYRRGVYMHWQRQFLHPMLRAFDAPSREECTASRSTSNTPLASLTLMNDPSFVEAARGLALRTLGSGKTIESQPSTSERDSGLLQQIFQDALGRRPDDYELSVLREILQSARKDFAADPDSAKKYLNVGLFDGQWDSEPQELAAWTEVARAVLNLNELIVRP